MTGFLSFVASPLPSPSLCLLDLAVRLRLLFLILQEVYKRGMLGQCDHWVDASLAGHAGRPNELGARNDCEEMTGPFLL